MISANAGAAVYDKQALLASNGESRATWAIGSGYLSENCQAQALPRVSFLLSRTGLYLRNHGQSGPGDVKILRQSLSLVIRQPYDRHHRIAP
jgi:hypothetical protein